jgi:general secretion pathway protein F
MNTHNYQYRAVDAEGKTRLGQMASISQASVGEALARRGWVPIEIGLARQGARSGRWRWTFIWPGQEQVSARDLLFLTQSLAVLLGAGLTVDRALQISSGMNPRPAIKQLNSILLKSVRSGKTLSRAFEASGQRLPPFLRSMIEAGEAGGALPQTLTWITELQARHLEMKERVHSALLYPSLLAIVVLLTLMLLLTFVLPRFEVLFAESQGQLPWSTRAVLGTGRFVADYWWALVVVMFATAAAVYGWLRTPAGRRRFDEWVLRTPLTMGLPKGLNTARFLRTVGTLSQNGAPLPSALRIARGTLSNRRLDEAVGHVISDVQSGASLSSALAKSLLFPEVAVQLSRVGEESGQLDALLLSSAKVLEEDCQLKLERLLSLLVPALTIGMALIVAGLISSVLIGLLSINDLAF